MPWCPCCPLDIVASSLPSIPASWTNTVEGAREAKFRAREERLAREEQERQRIDEEEERWRQAERRRKIEEANVKQYYQESRVKHFHGALLERYSQSVLRRDRRKRMAPPT